MYLIEVFELKDPNKRNYSSDGDVKILELRAQHLDLGNVVAAVGNALQRGKAQGDTEAAVGRIEKALRTSARNGSPATASAPALPVQDAVEVAAGVTAAEVPGRVSGGAIDPGVLAQRDYRPGGEATSDPEL